MTLTKEEQVLGLPAAESKCLTRMKGRTEREREELEVNGSEQVKDVFFFGLYIAACMRVKLLLSVVSDSAPPWLPGSSVHGILQARTLE